jgi:hypothetical protein
MPLVPSLVHQLVTHLRSSAGARARQAGALHSLQNVGSGAAYLPPALADEFLKLAPGVDRVSQGACAIDRLRA